jgi:deoxycytidine triphosphate deaminase
MSLLSYEELLALVARGIIRNIDTDAINAASIDITLGAKVLKECKLNGDTPIVRLSERENIHTIEEDSTDGIYLQPGEFILAQSEQEFYLPNDISAEYKLKSSMARIGLNHALAGWCDAGWYGSVLTLELKNWTKNHIIRLKKGDKIGQMIFFHHREVPKDRSYGVRGRYNNDKETTGAKS